MVRRLKGGAVPPTGPASAVIASPSASRVNATIQEVARGAERASPAPGPVPAARLRPTGPEAAAWLPVTAVVQALPAAASSREVAPVPARAALPAPALDAPRVAPAVITVRPVGPVAPLVITADTASEVVPGLPAPPRPSAHGAVGAAGPAEVPLPAVPRVLRPGVKVRPEGVVGGIIPGVIAVPVAGAPVKARRRVAGPRALLQP